MGENSDPANEDRWPRPDLIVTIAALGLAMGLTPLVAELSSSGAGLAAPSALGYFVFWLPLLAATILVRRRNWGGPSPIRWQLKPLDLLWGIGLGLLLRLAAALAELSMRGAIVAPSFLLPAKLSVIDLATLIFGGVVAPVVIAPVVEEFFFRGTLLGSLMRAGGKPIGSILAVVVSSLLFALPHAITSTTMSGGATRFVIAGILGLGVGAITMVTGRIGGAIVAHITFNVALFLLVLG